MSVILVSLSENVSLPKTRFGLMVCNRRMEWNKLDNKVFHCLNITKTIK